ncbi:YidH family protein [Photobacterium gaetbulicola]|uniref:YidH family protein n=1 Tax=Photobacterium gaetbulicola TaxID=1295392 RepID=UPI0009DFEE89|nr:DUF202 domain-containing protein [Photobacterium gaetbulicola]
MKKLYSRNNREWREEGTAPDDRFSLANEKTYLAWIRTSLALLAGAIALDQLTPVLANPTIRLIISCFLCVCSGLVAIYAYRRWSLNKQSAFYITSVNAILIAFSCSIFSSYRIKFIVSTIIFLLACTYLGTMLDKVIS